MNDTRITFEHKKGKKTVFVFGAGMEMSEPIKLPSSKDLPIEILTDLFIDSGNEMKKVTKYIKEQSKCSYTFEGLIYSRIKDIFQDSNDFGIKDCEEVGNSTSEFSPFINAFRKEVGTLKSGGGSTELENHI